MTCIIGTLDALYTRPPEGSGKVANVRRWFSTLSATASFSNYPPLGSQYQYPYPRRVALHLSAWQIEYHSTSWTPKITNRTWPTLALPPPACLLPTRDIMSIPLDTYLLLRHHEWPLCQTLTIRPIENRGEHSLAVSSLSRWLVTSPTLPWCSLRFYCPGAKTTLTHLHLDYE